MCGAHLPNARRTKYSHAQPFSHRLTNSYYHPESYALPYSEPYRHIHPNTVHQPGADANTRPARLLLSRPAPPSPPAYRRQLGTPAPGSQCCTKLLGDGSSNRGTTGDRRPPPRAKLQRRHVG
jgi:hypothetical protein